MAGSIAALGSGRTLAAEAKEPPPVAGYVHVVGGRLHYLSAGEGRPLILLHKLGGRSQEWRRMLPALAAEYRVIAFDLAGHGKSQMQGEPPYIVTQEAVAAQVMAALDTLEVAPPYRFIGSSLGGCTAMVCAALWPQRVAGVVSVGSKLGGGVSLEALDADAVQFIADGFFDMEENPLPRDPSYARTVFGLEDEVIAREQNQSRALAGRWIQPLTRGVFRFNYLASLPNVTAPVLLAWGERGNYGEFVDTARTRLTNSQKQIIKDSGAFPHEEAPEATTAVAMAFLDNT